MYWQRYGKGYMEKRAFDASRFLVAQEPVYASVVDELGRGRKTSHWMWFIFPQLAALGRSSTARRYGLDGVEDAHAFHKHAVLGARLRHCSALLLAVPDRSAYEILGSPDDLKLRSCMTLFKAALPLEPVYGEVLQRFYDGAPDELTLELLRASK